jgi:hypothetical protein
MNAYWLLVIPATMLKETENGHTAFKIAKKNF